AERGQHRGVARELVGHVPLVTAALRTRQEIGCNASVVAMRRALAFLLLLRAATATAAGYPRFDEVAARLHELARSSGGRARVVELGRSVQGRPILALVVGTAEARVLYVGLHHAREWVSADLVLRL